MRGKNYRCLLGRATKFCMTVPEVVSTIIAVSPLRTHMRISSHAPSRKRQVTTRSTGHCTTVGPHYDPQNVCISSHAPSRKRQMTGSQFSAELWVCSTELAVCHPSGVKNLWRWLQDIGPLGIAPFKLVVYKLKISYYRHVGICQIL